MNIYEIWLILLLLCLITGYILFKKIPERASTGYLRDVIGVFIYTIILIILSIFIGLIVKRFNIDNQMFLFGFVFLFIAIYFFVPLFQLFHEISILDLLSGLPFRAIVTPIYNDPKIYFIFYIGIILFYVFIIFKVFQKNILNSNTN